MCADDTGEQLCKTHGFDLEKQKHPKNKSIVCSDMCSDSEISSLLVVDHSNRCVRRFSPLSPQASPVYKCAADVYPKAVHLVLSTDNGPGALLVVERRTGDAVPDRYALAVATWTDDAFTEKSQLALPSLSDSEPNAVHSSGTTSAGQWLVGNAGAKALEVVDIYDPANVLCSATPLPLDFTLRCFSIGYLEGTEFLAAIEIPSTRVRVMRIECAPPRLTRLHVFDVPTVVDRVLLVERHLLLAHLHEERASHHVDCWLLEGGGSNARRMRQAIGVDREMYISCWRAVGQKLVLNDANRLQLNAFEYAACVRFSAAHCVTEWKLLSLCFYFESTDPKFMFY